MIDDRLLVALHSGQNESHLGDQSQTKRINKFTNQKHSGTAALDETLARTTTADAWHSIVVSRLHLVPPDSSSRNLSGLESDLIACELSKRETAICTPLLGESF